ncbi:MAG: sodium-dependent transporter, partial [Arenicellales bacterium]|nr:sodium-dependent transporter [Arenicellales bacterium]
TMHLWSSEEQAEANPIWRYLGWIMTITGIVILSYLSVVGGWMLAYVVRTAAGIFEGIELVERVRSTFSVLISDPEKLLAWHTIFMVMTVGVVGGKFRQGVEIAAKLLVPAIFVLLLLLLVRAILTGVFSQNLQYFYNADFARLTLGNVVHAAHQAFLGLSLGVGVMLVYSAYLSKAVSLSRVSIAIVSLDTLVILLAGLAIYPVLHVNELQPTSGVTLVFQTLPMAYGNLSFGAYWGTLFFLLLALTAWTSAIALLEPPVAWLCERYGWSRAKAAAVSGLLVWVLGLVSILSFSHWKFSFEFSGVERTNGALDILSIATSNFLLPITGILIAVFTGWVVSRERSRLEMGRSKLNYAVWSISIRFAVPLLVGLLFIYLLLDPA